MKTTKLCLMASAIAALATACAGTEELEVGVVARIHTEDNLTIEFARLENGAIVASEVGPIATPSQISRYMVHEPTALELFRAIAPAEEAPLELEMDHLATTDAEPRDLSLDFREFSYTEDTDPATCTFASDWTWFVNTFNGTNWDYWNYYPGTSATSLNILDLGAQHMITHVCHYSGSEMELQLLNLTTFGGYTLDDIDAGERGIIYLLGINETADPWWSIAETVNQSNATFRHGVMDPVDDE